MRPTRPTCMDIVESNLDMVSSLKMYQVQTQRTHHRMPFIGQDEYRSALTRLRQALMNIRRKALGANVRRDNVDSTVGDAEDSIRELESCMSTQYSERNGYIAYLACILRDIAGSCRSLTNELYKEEEKQ